MLIMLFAVTLGWLPASGRGATVPVLGVPLSVLTLDGWLSLILPAGTIALAKAAMIVRVTRAATRESMPMDYLKFARAQGLSEQRALGAHLPKHLPIPTL